MTRTTPIWADLEPADVESGWLQDFAQVNSSQVLDALQRRHTEDGWNRPGRWVFLREVYAQTGAYGQCPRFDGLAIGLVPSVGYARVVYEVKVSRGDWLRELRPVTEVAYRGHRLGRRRAVAQADVTDLESQGYRVETRNKWDAALAISHELWFVAPPRCIGPSEVPVGAGLLEVRPWGRDRELRARVVVKAGRRKPPEPGPEFWASVLRSLADRRLQVAGA